MMALLQANEQTLEDPLAPCTREPVHELSLISWMIPTLAGGPAQCKA